MKWKTDILDSFNPGKLDPLALPYSRLMVKLSPVLGRMSPSGEISFNSRLHLQTLNYQQTLSDKGDTFPSYNLNGTTVMNVITDPNLKIQIRDDEIFLNSYFLGQKTAKWWLKSSF